MITQKEMLEYAEAKANLKAIEARIDAMRQTLIGKRKDEQEPGLMGITFTPADAPKTQYAEVYKAIYKNHPELRGAMETIKASKTTKTEGVYQIAVAVQATV